MKSHITSIEHKNNTPQGEFKDYEELKKLFEEESAINKRKELDSKDSGDWDTKDYLEFVSFVLVNDYRFVKWNVSENSFKMHTKIKNWSSFHLSILIEDLCQNLSKIASNL